MSDRFGRRYERVGRERPRRGRGRGDICGIASRRDAPYRPPRAPAAAVVDLVVGVDLGEDLGVGDGQKVDFVM